MSIWWILSNLITSNSPSKHDVTINNSPVEKVFLKKFNLDSSFLNNWNLQGLGQVDEVHPRRTPPGDPLDLDGDHDVLHWWRCWWCWRSSKPGWWWWQLWTAAKHTLILCRQDRRRRSRKVGENWNSWPLAKTQCWACCQVIPDNWGSGGHDQASSVDEYFVSLAACRSVSERGAERSITGWRICQICKSAGSRQLPSNFYPNFLLTISRCFAQ